MISKGAVVSRGPWDQGAGYWSAKQKTVNHQQKYGMKRGSDNIHLQKGKKTNKNVQYK